MKAIHRLLLLSFYLLTACSGTGLSETLIRPSDTPPPISTATHRPGATLTSSPSLTPTQTSSPTPRPPTRTPQATATDFDPFSPAALETVFAQVPEVTVNRSPNGLWRAERLVYPCVRMGEFNEVSVMELQVVNAITGERYPIVEQVISCGGLGAFGLGVLYWSPNSRYLYYTDAAFGVPDGLACYWTPAMYRIDLSDWSSLSLVYGDPGPVRNLLTLRYDDRLVFWDLDGGEVGAVEGIVDDYPIGGFAWAEDGQKLAYLQTNSACWPYEKSVIVIVNWPALTQKIALEWAGVVHFTWDAPYRLLITDEAGRQWHYNIATETLQQFP